MFADLSVSGTLHELLVLGAAHPTERPGLLLEAAKLQARFKVPDKRFWQVKVKALAASGQWDELRKFANERKSPVGYQPFAERCIEARQPPDAIAYYIDRMVESEQRSARDFLRRFFLQRGGAVSFDDTS